MPENRLFVPLSKEPFYDFLERGKEVETRRYGGNFTEETVIPGRRVELRLGYSGKLSLWGEVGLVVIGSIGEIFSVFDLKIVQPRYKSVEEATWDIQVMLRFPFKFIAFQVCDIHQPPH